MLEGPHPTVGGTPAAAPGPSSPAGAQVITSSESHCLRTQYVCFVLQQNVTSINIDASSNPDNAEFGTVQTLDTLISLDRHLGCISKDPCQLKSCEAGYMQGRPKL